MDNQHFNNTSKELHSIDVKAEDDVRPRTITSIQNSFDDIQTSLMEKKTNEEENIEENREVIDVAKKIITKYKETFEELAK